MTFHARLTSVFAKFFSLSRDKADQPNIAEVDADANLPNFQADNGSTPPIMVMGLRSPQGSRRPSGRRGRAASR